MENHLRNVLKENMAWYGHKQTDLARDAGVTYSHLSNIIRGERGASLEVWERLLNVYGLTISVTSKR
jgi:plasmid maintenance system antidote protein VapI